METYKAATGISVIICCHNSVQRLAPTLEHLARQKTIPGLPAEIIVVDNASQDHTTWFALAEWNKYNVPHLAFKVIKQPRPGLIYARQKGVAEAAYDYIIFCDDDNWLHEDYLQTAVNTLNASPKIGAAGGFGIAVTDGDFPAWFDTFKGAYAVGAQKTDSDASISAINYLWGAGMITRKVVFEKAYFKHPPLLTGRQGGKLSSGEDTEYIMRIHLMGYSLFYNKDLRYKHYIAPHRLTTLYQQNLYHDGATSSSAVLNSYRKQIIINRLPWFAKFKLVVASMIRSLLSALKIGKWEYSYESQMLYFLTGFRVKTITPECIAVRNIYLYLKYGRSL